MQITKNFHTHTVRCNHATGNVVDYIEAGIQGGLVEMGISDHTPLYDNRWPGARMPMCDLNDYIAEIDFAQREYSDIKILKAAECEYAPEYQTFYEDVLLGEQSFDYLVGGVHYVPYKGDWIGVSALTAKSLSAFVKYSIKSMESGVFAFLAHPDVFGCAGLVWDEESIACSKDILQAAEELNMPLEINGYGFRKNKVNAPDGDRVPYPLVGFWELAQDYNIKVVCNSDAHRPEDMLGNIDDAINMAEANNLTFADTDLFYAQKYREIY
jgi:histidinol-phosphatase (PHP family)